MDTSQDIASSNLDNMTAQLLAAHPFIDHNTTFAPTQVNGSTPAPSLPKAYFNLVRDCSFILTGIVICVGLIFNTLAFVVFATSAQLRCTTTAHYLMALSVADCLCLITEIFRWLVQPSTFNIGSAANVLHTSNVMCKLVFVLRYVGHMSSAWITVAITVERFITIRFPLKVNRISTPKIAKIMIGLVFLVCTICALFPIWCVGLDTYNHEIKCLVINNKWYNVGLWLTIRVGVLLVPSIIVGVLTAYIIYLLKSRDRMLYHLQAHSNMRPSGTAISLERQLTGMLLAVAIAFVALRLPYIIIYNINHNKLRIWQPLDPYVGYHIYVAYRLTDVLAIANYSINFFLYFWCGSTFRKQLATMFGFRQVQRRSSWTGGSTISSFFSRRSSTLSNATRSSMSKGQLSHVSRSASAIRDIKDIELQADVLFNHIGNGKRSSSDNL